MSHLVTIASFDNFNEVYFAKAKLDMAQIDCVMVDEYLPRLAWHYARAIGGIKLQVRAEDVDAAIEALSSEIPERLSFRPGSEYVQPRCPHCSSLNVDEIDEFEYSCEECDTSWEDVIE